MCRHHGSPTISAVRPRRILKSSVDFVSPVSTPENLFCGGGGLASRMYASNLIRPIMRLAYCLYLLSPPELPSRQLDGEASPCFRRRICGQRQGQLEREAAKQERLSEGYPPVPLHAPFG